MKDYEKLGKLIIVIAAVSIPVILLLSEGYYPDAGLFYGLSYKMSVIDTYLCINGTDPKDHLIYPEDCWHILLMTKYLIILSLGLAGYGFLIWKNIIKSPADFFRNLVKTPSDS